MPIPPLLSRGWVCFVTNNIKNMPITALTDNCQPTSNITNGSTVAYTTTVVTNAVGKLTNLLNRNNTTTTVIKDPARTTETGAPIKTIYSQSTNSIRPVCHDFRIGSHDKIKYIIPAIIDTFMPDMASIWLTLVA